MSTLGDIATVAAPTVVALAAIGASTWQQSRSRAFDRAEREKERQHDREMREAAERHERTLSDLDYQRRLVDDVAAAMEAANDAVRMLDLQWDTADSGPPVHMRDLVSAVSAAGDRLKVATARMVLRFGSSHDAVRIIAGASDATHRAYFAAVAFEFSHWDEKQVAMELGGASSSVQEAVDAFLTVTGGIVGSAPERD